MSKQTLGVFIGRFQPFHAGHLETTRQALELFDKVIIIIGSADVPATTKNPLDIEARSAIITAAFTTEELARIHITRADDHDYQPGRWIEQIKILVEWTHSPDQWDITLVGHHKDESSSYLDWFPNWNFYESENFDGMGATTIRDQFFNGSSQFISPNFFCNEKHRAEVFDRMTPLADILRPEWCLIHEYESIWGKGPHRTADALVECNGHILLIERGQAPGKGLLAFPGGFLEKGERLIDASIRELMEETNIGITKSELIDSASLPIVFDAKNRDPRSWNISGLTHFKITATTLPDVHPADDAAKTSWYPITMMHGKGKLFFADHYRIIQKLLNV